MLRPKGVLFLGFIYIACENIRFSCTPGDAIQCLHKKSSIHRVPNTNLSNFTCLLVDFGKVLCSSANELQQNSNASPREDYIPQILTVLFRDYSLLHLTFVVFCLLSVIHKQ